MVYLEIPGLVNGCLQKKGVDLQTANLWAGFFFLIIIEV